MFSSTVQQYYAAVQCSSTVQQYNALLVCIVLGTSRVHVVLLNKPHPLATAMAISLL